MFKYILSILVLVIISGCSKEDSPVETSGAKKANGYIRGEMNNGSWYSSSITIDEKNNTIFIKAVQTLTGNPNYSSSEINFRLINISQPILYGIGENEPGYVYFVKADYTLKGKNGSDVVYNAYHRDYSLMKINRFTENGIEADFNFIAYTNSFSDSIDISNGKIDISF